MAMLPNVPAAKIPKEVAQLLSSGLIRSVEYAGDYIINNCKHQGVLQPRLRR